MISYLKSQQKALETGALLFMTAALMSGCAPRIIQAFHGDKSSSILVAPAQPYLNVSEQFAYDSNVDQPGITYASTKDSAGNIYVSGSRRISTGSHRWIVRKLTAATGTWATIDDFSYGNGTNTQAAALAVDASGNVY